MELSSTQFVPAAQQRVWDALNDPQTLKECITGCESIDAVSDSEYHAVLAAKIGPITARFKGKLTISDFNPPHSYSLVFEGQGGAAGFAKGGASVSLAPTEGGTNLSYSAKAQVGGKLAQIGSRLVDSVAKKTADDFFAAFIAKVGIKVEQPSSEAALAAHAAVVPAPAAVMPAPAASSAPASGMTTQRVLYWGAGAVAMLLAAVYWIK
jgi:carbon monoxide dehydrogenase subunit G